MKRRVLVLISLVAATMVPGPSAQAALWTGTCGVGVAIDFGSPIGVVPESTSYDITLVPIGDLDPLNAGTQSCVITMDPLEPTRETQGYGSGSSTAFSCAGAVASGGWSQQFTDSSGSQTPPGFSGSHTFAGTWDNWVLTVRSASLNVVGVVHLTSPFEILTPAQCALGGVTRLTFLGQMVFQDP